MECSAAIQVLPQTEGTRVIEIVDKIISHIKSTGLNYSVGPFETTVEGGFDEIMDLVKECQLICIRQGANEVMSYIKIAYAPESGVWSIDEKIEKHQK
ncbi:MAG: thiamine-binding protein [Oscillospiraceae bacterium]|nr:thiamine-binding protein [Oscillospiraceae bacterium]